MEVNRIVGGFKGTETLHFNSNMSLSRRVHRPHFKQFSLELLPVEEIVPIATVGQ